MRAAEQIPGLSITRSLGADKNSWASFTRLGMEQVCSPPIGC